MRASDDAVDGENDLFSLRANENKSSDMWWPYTYITCNVPYMYIFHTRDV